MKTDDLAFLNNIMDLLLDAVCVVDSQGRFLYVSAACERIFGYRPEEMIGRPMIDLVFHEDRLKTLNAVVEILVGDHEPHFENRYVRKDGAIVHIMWSARWSEADQVRVAVARDITERKRAELLQDALYAISEAAHTAEDSVSLFQRTHEIVSGLLPANNFFIALYDPRQDQLTFPYHVDEYAEAPPPQGLDSGTWSAEVIRAGRPLHLRFDATKPRPEQIQPDLGGDAIDCVGVPLSVKNRIVGALVVKSYSADVRYTEQDIDLLHFVSVQIAAAIDRKQTDAWLQHVARHDSLTGLPNRELFHDRLTTAIALAGRNRTRLSILYLDLDTFKQVNDTLGHASGDLLLQQVARRLKQCVRKSDTVGRFGGDEFLVLLNSTELPEHALLVAEKIRCSLGQPFDLAGHRLSVSPSIGIAIYPDHGDDHEQLIRRADEAMYGAKRGGGNRFQMAAENPINSRSALRADMSGGKTHVE
jgi:diguanylate cyclase (GGDEF)-like protein/PAS domain S-box-containing protein